MLSISKIKGIIIGIILLTAIWVLLTLPFDTTELVAGVIVALLTAVFFAGRIEVLSDVRITPLSLIHSIIYVPVFLVELLKANFDVARRVIDPRLPINPGIVRVKTKLRTRLGRIALANSITLTPGTLTVETDGDIFYIHWIDVDCKDINESTEMIVRKFERHLIHIFG
jgi:multicomponent Na+:H+ antiporter subunit E